MRVAPSVEGLLSRQGRLLSPPRPPEILSQLRDGWRPMVKVPMPSIRTSSRGMIRSLSLRFKEKRNVSFRDFLLRAWICGALLAERALIVSFLSISMIACAAPGMAPDAGLPVAGLVEGRFEVYRNGEGRRDVMGYIAQTRYTFSGGDVTLWLVENAHFQDVGFIDENGRAYRNAAFSDRPRWVTTASMEECARVLLEADASVKLTKLDGDVLPQALRNIQAADAAHQR